MGRPTVIQPYRLPFPSKQGVTTVAWSPDGKCLALADIAPRLHIWKLGTDATWRSQDLSAKASVTRIRWAPDGEHLALVLEGRAGALIINAGTGVLRRSWGKDARSVIDVAWSSSGKMVHALLGDGTLISRDWGTWAKGTTSGVE